MHQHNPRKSQRNASQSRWLCSRSERQTNSSTTTFQTVLRPHAEKGCSIQKGAERRETDFSPGQGFRISTSCREQGRETISVDTDRRPGTNSGRSASEGEARIQEQQAPFSNSSVGYQIDDDDDDDDDDVGSMAGARGSATSSASGVKTRFQLGWQRFLPFLGYHHVLMFCIGVSIILLSLLLAGCSSSSPAIPNIFLLSLYYEKYQPAPDTAQVDYNGFSAIANIAGGATLQARVGYFGICVNPDGGSWLCSNNATALAKEVSVDQDPLNLIWLAGQFKDMIVFPYLIIIAIIFAFICLLLLATFPGWHEEEDSEGSERVTKPFPPRSLSQVSLAIIFIASIFVLVSVLWQHTASVAASIIAQDFGNGSVKSGVGSSAMWLGWVSFTLLIVVTIGLLIMILSIRVLGEMLRD
ncbi:hypothetical protein E4U41_000852 [Claviceps citrina]|nr:hypothetical protein E4U41_000852 [Claviceps citrina]